WRVSSDLHEWRNDGGAVSTRDSVKLKSLLRCSVSAARRKDPVNLYYSFALDFEFACVGKVGGFEAWTPVRVEPTLKYHPGTFEVLTLVRYPDRGQCMVGSLTGAVSSSRVTEEYEGALSTVGNRA